MKAIPLSGMNLVALTVWLHQRVALYISSTISSYVTYHHGLTKAWNAKDSFQKCHGYRAASQGQSEQAGQVTHCFSELRSGWDW